VPRVSTRAEDDAAHAPVLEACTTGEAGVCARAASLAERSCDSGRAERCAELAELYLAGDGVERDIGRAKALYEIGCGGGFMPGC
jgi:TPR repeat protein